MSARRVAVDLGANSGRVAVGELVGGGLRYEEVHRFPNGPVETAKGLKWDFDRLLVEIEKGLRLCGEAGEVASVGVDSWAVDYGVVDEMGRIVCSPFHYRDSRTEGVMEREMEVREAEIFGETGLQFLPFNTLYQLMAHLESDPGLFEPGRRLLMVPDLVSFWLGGRAGVERTNASTTQFYDPLRRGWSERLLGLIEPVRSMLPEIVDSGADLGGLRENLRCAPGLGRTRIIAPATHDTGSAVLAVPMVDREKSAYVISGTWSLVGFELEEALVSEEVRTANCSNEVGAGGTIRFLKNVMGLWIFQECMRGWGRSDVASVVAEAEGWVDRVGTFDVDDRVFLDPGSDMPARVLSAVPGLDEGEAAVSASIFKSLAIKTWQVLRQGAGLAGREIECIHVVGGGSQNRLMNQLLADEAGVKVISGPVEATLIGNLLVQFQAAGELSDPIREVVRRSSVLETFDPRT